MLESIQSDRQALPERVAAELVRLITERQLKAGDRLPNEFEMARQLEVGRGTIREAVKLLVSRKVLEIRRGLGTFVCERPGVAPDPLGFAFTPDKRQLVLDLWETRMAIEPQIAELAAQRADAAGLRELQALADEIADRCAAGRQYLELDVRFHEMIARLSQNTVLLTLIPVIQQGVHAFVSVTAYALAADTVASHQRIIDALSRGDAAGAAEAMRAHLQLNRDKIDEIFAERQEV